MLNTQTFSTKIIYNFPYSQLFHQATLWVGFQRGVMHIVNAVYRFSNLKTIRALPRLHVSSSTLDWSVINTTWKTPSESANTHRSNDWSIFLLHRTEYLILLVWRIEKSTCPNSETEAELYFLAHNMSLLSSTPPPTMGYRYGTSIPTTHDINCSANGFRFYLVLPTGVWCVPDAQF